MANERSVDDSRQLKKAVDEIAKIAATVEKDLKDLQVKIKKISDIADW